MMQRRPWRPPPWCPSRFCRRTPRRRWVTRLDMPAWAEGVVEIGPGRRIGRLHSLQRSVAAGCCSFAGINRCRLGRRRRGLPIRCLRRRRGRGLRRLLLRGHQAGDKGGRVGEPSNRWMPNWRPQRWPVTKMHRHHRLLPYSFGHRPCRSFAWHPLGHRSGSPRPTQRAPPPPPAWRGRRPARLALRSRPEHSWPGRPPSGRRPSGSSLSASCLLSGCSAPWAPAVWARSPLTHRPPARQRRRKMPRVALFADAAAAAGAAGSGGAVLLQQGDQAGERRRHIFAAAPVCIGGARWARCGAATVVGAAEAVTAAGGVAAAATGGMSGTRAKRTEGRDVAPSEHGPAGKAHFCASSAQAPASRVPHISI